MHFAIFRLSVCSDRCRISVSDNSCSKTMILFINLTAHKNGIGNMLVKFSFRERTKYTFTNKAHDSFNQQLIYRKIQHMLDSQSDLGAGGKISTSTVFYTIIHITLLKYFKSLVTCDSLFKQTPKKEDPSICFRSATLENFTPEHRSAVVSDFECHSPFALFHKKLNCNNNRRVSPKKQKK